jgi:hypothetical protein
MPPFPRRFRHSGSRARRLVVPLSPAVKPAVLPLRLLQLRQQGRAAVGEPLRDADEGAEVMPSLTSRMGLRPDHFRASSLDHFREAAPAAKAISQEACDSSRKSPSAVTPLFNFSAHEACTPPLRLLPPPRPQRAVQRRGVAAEKRAPRQRLHWVSGAPHRALRTRSNP